MVKSVKIGGVNYAVERVETIDRDRNTDGQITYCDQLIQIRTDIQPDQAMRVLIHECLHAIARHSHTDLGTDENTERIIDALAYGLLALIKDNPKMFA